MDYREFLSDVKDGRLKPVYLLYGREKYLMDSLLKKLKEKHIDPNFESLNYIYISGGDSGFEEIRNANETLPFMADKKIVVVEDWKLFGKKKDSDGSADEENFLEYLETLGSSSVLLFLVNSEKIDSRRKLIKQIGKYGGIVELNRLKEGELSKWIEGKFRRDSKSISRSCLNEFMQYTGYLDKETDIDLNGIDHEVEKLCSYLGDRTEVEREDIERVVTKSIQSNIFKLVELLGQKRPDRSIDTLNDIINLGIPTQKIIYMIIRQLRLLLVTESYMDRGYGQKAIKDATGVKFDFVINKLIAQARAFGKGKISEALEKALVLDRQIKTSKIDDRLGIEKLLVEMSR